MAFIENEPGDISTEAVKLMNLIKKRGGFILSSGCEIPLEAKPENIKAMVKAAKGKC